MTGPAGRTVRRYGERALLVELPAGEAPHAVARAIRALGADLVDVVPAARTVLVVLPRADGLAAVAAAVRDVPAPDPGADRAVPVVLPVVYDGADLDEVAALVGRSREEVVARHHAAAYTVAFVGFAPGFAYLTGGDPVLQVPRRDSPRASVPAGSVALADLYTGVYPRATPGGWRLVGRTTATLFDPDADPPGPLVAGTPVRFVPVDP